MAAQHPPLRLFSWLAPSVPAPWFHGLAAYLSHTLGTTVSVTLDDRTSGPRPDGPDPFAEGRADIGFMCSPSYLWLTDKPTSSVELARAALVSADPRADGKPVYFSDIVVRGDADIFNFDELRGANWAFNDTCSLSGYFNLVKRVAAAEEGAGFFGSLIQAGSHLRSLEMVLAGEADAAAIDSNVLLLRRAADRRLRKLRIIESWGPFPIQPIVLRQTLPKLTRKAIEKALLRMKSAHGGEKLLAGHGFHGFAQTSPAAYAGERAALASCTELCVKASLPLPWRGPEPPDRTVA